MTVDFAEVDLPALDIRFFADGDMGITQLHLAKLAVPDFGNEKVVAGRVDAVVLVEDKGHDERRAGFGLAAEKRAQPSLADVHVRVHAYGEARFGPAKPDISHLGAVQILRLECE